MLTNPAEIQESGEKNERAARSSSWDLRNLPQVCSLDFFRNDISSSSDIRVKSTTFFSQDGQNPPVDVVENVLQSAEHGLSTEIVNGFFIVFFIFRMHCEGGFHKFI